MFKIAETNGRSLFRPVAVPEGAGAFTALSQYCISEEWTANLADGTILLGHWSAALHGLQGRECGLIGLTRAYDRADRRNVVSLFEQAAAQASSFCFSATISLGEHHRQPVFCMAESARDSVSGNLVLTGMFLFPRFKIDSPVDGSIAQPRALMA